jgi:hypothetical protein
MGSFGMKISPDGVEVKTGADKDMVLSSKYPLLKGSLSGSGTLSVPQSGKIGDITSINTGTDTLTCVAHGLLDGEQVFIDSDGTMPGGLSKKTVYYVVNKTANTFQLSTTSGGSVLDITSAGSGVISFSKQNVVVIAHGLPYIPMVQAYWNDRDGDYFVPDDFYYFGAYIFGFGGTDFQFIAFANATHVYLIFSAEDYGSGGANIDFKYAYYIFLDKGRL